MHARPEETLHVVLVEPEIHWNTGNAGRTCLAANARLHLVEPLGFSLDAREVRRAGLDYWSRVDPVVWRSWSEFAKGIPDLGAPVFFDPAAERTIWEVDFTRNNVLVFGPETRGLPRSVTGRHPERAARIPQFSTAVRSLNLSTSVGIVLYEALRQRADTPGTP